MSLLIAKLLLKKICGCLLHATSHQNSSINMRHLAWRLKRHSVSRVDTFVVIVVVSYQKLFFLHKRLFYNHKTKSWSKRKIHQSDLMAMICIFLLWVRLKPTTWKAVTSMMEWLWLFRMNSQVMVINVIGHRFSYGALNELVHYGRKLYFLKCESCGFYRCHRITNNWWR